jgi:hypothetical protein
MLCATQKNQSDTALPSASCLRLVFWRKKRNGLLFFLKRDVAVCAGRHGRVCDWFFLRKKRNGLLFFLKREVAACAGRRVRACLV